MGILSLILILINVAVSWKGFQDHSFYERYKFNVEKILIEKDYKRIITSSFLHINWMHLLFNMFSLYVFSDAVELSLGIPTYALIYFISLIGGNLFAGIRR
mgnify:CR=1 FL=1